MANTNLIKNKYKLDFIKYRYLWLSLTGILLIPCILAILYLTITQPNHAPLKLGIDFTGGTILQYSVDKKLETKDISNIRTSIESIGIKNPKTTHLANDESAVTFLISLPQFVHFSALSSMLIPHFEQYIFSPFKKYLL